MWRNVRKKLNDYKLRFNLLKYHFVKYDNECPEFKFTQKEIWPFENGTAAL